MLKTVATLPVKTRLPLGAWALAGLVTLLSIINSLIHVSSSPMVQAAAVTAQHASMSSLLHVFGTLL
jgi:hypothetical protein